MVEHVKIEIEADFLARQTRAEPIQALAELIWNSVDADATKISIDFEFKDLAKGMSKIVVTDNGEGIPRSEAKNLFGHLGGSWKRLRRRTEKGRIVHGQEGRGRYKAFALGGSAEWKVCYQANGSNKAYSISLLESDLKDIAINDEKPAPKRPTGVIVEITDLKKDFQGLHSEAGMQELAEIFALYLKNYRDVAISINGEKIDPAQAIANVQPIELTPIEGADGKNYSAEVEIVEWLHETKRALYLCNADGFPLSQIEMRFHVGQFSFSAYLKSDYINELHNAERLGLGELDPKLHSAVEEARQKIKDHFRNRAAERARTVVETWKAENVYPFAGEARSPIERAERQVFDIVAVNVQTFAPEFERADTKTKALHLRMLRHAIEKSPDELQLILKEVLDLPQRKQQELAELLQETTLSAIITAAKTIADRLKFLGGLEAILFEPEKKGRLKERSQLHKIVAEETWIFGEQYNLWVSDRSLTEVLRKHKEHLDSDIRIDEPVRVIDKKRGIVDLMLSRAVHRHRSNDFEHLVIELKAPSVSITDKEIAQINKYALAVAADERFATVPGVRWHFWLISNALSEYASKMIEGGPDPQQRLVFQDGRIAVGIKTWGELIEENRARLQFFQEHLQYTADESTALQHLQERHAQFLEGVITEEDAPIEQIAEQSNGIK
jgi:hypothetical protein